jgi:mitochondrial fission protein ELM1
VLGDGTPGAENQSLAFLNRLGVSSFTMVRLPPTPVFRVVPPLLHIYLLKLMGKFGNGHKILGFSAGWGHIFDKLPSEELPNLIVACGRRTAPLSWALKYQMGRFNRESPCFNVQIQHPRTPSHYFDAIITPAHDYSSTRPLQPSRGENVHTIPGSLHMVDEEWVNAGIEQHFNIETRGLESKSWEHRDRTLSIILGGPHRNCNWSNPDIQSLIEKVVEVVMRRDSRLQQQTKINVVCSRRTPNELVSWLRLYIDSCNISSITLWADEERDGENIYQSALSVSDAIIATADSVSMVSECDAVCRVRNSNCLLHVACSRYLMGKHKRFYNGLKRRDRFVTLSLLFEWLNLRVLEKVDSPKAHFTESGSLEDAMASVGKKIRKELQRGEGV